MSARDGSPWLRVSAALLLTGLVVVTVYPIFWMTMGALKPQSELVLNPFGLPQAPSFDSLRAVWLDGDFPRYFLNSLIVSSFSTLGLCLICAMAAYVFVRQRIRSANWLFRFIIVGIMIPTEVLLIPVFRMMAELGLRNSLVGLVLVYLSWSPFGILILRAYFLTIPGDLIDAARIDGCSEYRVFWDIYRPLAMPALVTVAILYFLWTWNDFLWPLVLVQNQDWYTIQLGVLQYKTKFQIDYAKQVAALAIAVWPPLIFYLVFRRQIQRGLLAGAIKM